MPRLPSLLAAVAVCLLLAACATPAPPDIAQLPVVPRIDASLKARLRDVYQSGQAQGNHPEVFSKIGDSITDTPAFLTSLGAGPVEYGAYADLAPIVEYYRQTVVRETEGQPENSFQLHSFGALSGWKTTDLLDEGSRFWEPLCGAQETPLACELRNTRPAVALILIGPNDVGKTSLRDYERNLDEIVSITLNYGVIPVLSTLSPQSSSEDLAASVPDYNKIVLTVAQRHKVPVWNFWRALQPLPGFGLSEDGLHPSQNEALGGSNFSEAALQYGFPVRSLTALQVLAKIKAVVLDDGPPDP